MTRSSTFHITGNVSLEGNGFKPFKTFNMYFILLFLFIYLFFYFIYFNYLFYESSKLADGN